MVSEIQEERQGEGLRLQEQNHCNHYLHLGASAYSLFVLAIRSPQTKQKYLQRFGYFLDFAQVATEKGTSIEERCNKLAELANNEYQWLLNCIFNYLQLLRSRAESKQSLVHYIPAIIAAVSRRIMVKIMSAMWY